MTANLLTLQYKIQHNISYTLQKQTQIQTDRATQRFRTHSTYKYHSSPGLRHSTPTCVVFLSLLHFSIFCHRIQSRIPDPTPAMILAHRHTIFYKLSALSVWKCDWFLFSSLHTSDHGTQSPRRLSLIHI